MGWVFLGLLALIIAAPFLREGVRPQMNGAARTLAPGQFATLPMGLTHYQWRGPADGPVVVCVHGLTTPSFVWGPVAEALAADGYRVLTYDLFGRGFSDRPDGDQDGAFFVRQLNELLADQGVGDDITLIGYSMGGAVAAAYGAAHPDRLRQIALIAPAGMGHDLGPVSALVANYDRFGRWFMYAFYARSYARALEAERALPSAIDDIVDLQRRELHYRGFVPAVLASIRGILGFDQEGDHRSIAEADVPVLAIWGADDDIIPIAGRDALSKWNPAAHHHVITNAGHSITYTHVDDVLRALRDSMPAPER